MAMTSGSGNTSSCSREIALDLECLFIYILMEVLGSSWRKRATYFVSTGFILGICSKQQDFYHSFCCGESLFLM